MGFVKQGFSVIFLEGQIFGGHESFDKDFFPSIHFLPVICCQVTGSAVQAAWATLPEPLKLPQQVVGPQENDPRTLLRAQHQGTASGNVIRLYDLIKRGFWTAICQTIYITLHLHYGLCAWVCTKPLKTKLLQCKGNMDFFFSWSLYEAQRSFHV